MINDWYIYFIYHSLLYESSSLLIQSLSLLNKRSRNWNSWSVLGLGLFTDRRTLRRCSLNFRHIFESHTCLWRSMRVEDMSEIQANSAGHTRVSCSVYLVSKYLIKNYTLAYFFFCVVKPPQYVYLWSSTCSPGLWFQPKVTIIFGDSWNGSFPQLDQ